METMKMISFEEAQKKVDELKRSYNRCAEYEKGFMFWYDDGIERYGGFGSPIAVIKEDGSLKGFPQFLILGDNDFIRDIPVMDTLR